MATLKLPFQLESPDAATPVTTTADVKDPPLGKSQRELNELFNEGKNAKGEQVGKTYAAGTGIEISDKDTISVKEATSSQRGGMKIAPDTERVRENEFPVGLSNGFGVVGIPNATDAATGLMTKEDHRRLVTRSLGISYEPGADTVQWVNSYGAGIRLVRLSGANVASVQLSYGTVLQESHSLGDVDIAIAEDAVLTVKVVRTTDGQRAALGIGIHV